MGMTSETRRQQVLAWLVRHVPESRVRHILGVEEMCIALAQVHQQDPEKAAQAGLMHDLAKYFKPSKLLNMAKAEGLPIDPVDETNPHLLHADVGALVARDEFGVEDPEILEAIANHTLGRPAMGALSCIVFIADTAEPGRGDTPELDALRQISRHNLQQAVWMACDYSFKYLLESHRLIHPRTLMTRNWFLQQSHDVYKRTNLLNDKFLSNPDCSYGDRSQYSNPHP